MCSYPLHLTELEQRGCSQCSEVGQHLLHEAQPRQLQRDQQCVYCIINFTLSTTLQKNKNNNISLTF